MATIQIKYQVSDGYVGGKRPQTFSFDPDDLDPSMTDEQIEGQIWDMVDEDMRQKVSADVSNMDEAVASVRSHFKSANE